MIRVDALPQVGLPVVEDSLHVKSVNRAMPKTQKKKQIAVVNLLFPSPCGWGAGIAWQRRFETHHLLRKLDNQVTVFLA